MKPNRFPEFVCIFGAALTGTKGVMLDTLRHPPIAGSEPIVAGAFRKKFGKDMEPLDICHDPRKTK